MIEKFGPHYSMQNNPTVYDEEALTALEAIGRLGHKMNEVITHVNGMNVPEIVNVAPTGDKTGELDRVVIQGKLDKGFSVHLSAGEYYLNGPLLFRAGYTLRGETQKNTIINCYAGFIDHDPAVSVDHIAVRDLTARGPGSGVGIDISRKVAGIETGGRYSNFSNVSIAEYDTCMRLGGCWTVDVNHCRFDGLKTCVEQRGGCNNVKYDHCMFLGPVDQKTSIGLKISAEGGAENYGIRLDHCDFERHNVAVQGYYCVALNATSIYVEGVNTVFSLDSCPAFLCDGGYISYPERVCNTSNSNSAHVFSKCTGEIRNIFVRINSVERFYLTSTTTNFPVKVENINCVNDSTGECFTDAQQVNSIWNGDYFGAAYKPSFREIDMNYGSYLFNWNDHLYAPKDNTKQFKIKSVLLIPDVDITPTTSTAIRITIPASEIGLNGVDPVTIFETYLNAGQTYQAGTPITMGVKAPEYRNLIANNINLMVILSSVGSFAPTAKCSVIMEFASNNYVL